MQHLESERIAAFDHDAPTTGELAHLEACATCRAERVAFSVLSQRAMQVIDAPVPSTTPRLTDWDSLSARLRTEGLMETVDSRRSTTQSRVRNDWWRMAAAAVMLVAGGAVWGRFSDAASSLGPRSTDLPTIASDVVGSSLGLGNTGFGSVEEASKALAKSERDFNRISLWIIANDPSANASDVLRRRLAQLDQLVSASRAASLAAPQDRVLDHYYRSAFAAREQTIQQLGNALPPGRSLERF